MRSYSPCMTLRVAHRSLDYWEARLHKCDEMMI